MSTKSLSGFLMGVCAAAGAAASTCPPGRFDPLDGSNCVPAPIGSYVPTPGASAATPAPAGYFVPATGRTYATEAPVGYYVATPGQFAATPAQAGSYVDRTGATSETPAPVGYFTNSEGAVSPTPAPLGYFVGSTGRTVADAAPLGFYVATTGASAPTAVEAGFYTASTGAVSGIGAGMMASPLNMAMDAAQSILSRQNTMVTPDGQSLDVAVTANRTRYEQAGLSAQNNQTINSTAVLLQHTSDQSPTAWKIFGGLADQKLKASTAGSGQGRTWLLGASRGIHWGQAEPLVAAVYAGQSSADIVRNVTELSAAESQIHSASVRVMGVRLSTGIPVQAISARLMLEAGVVHYAQSATAETSSTTGTTAGLQTAKYGQMGIPVFVGFQHQFSAASIQWGVRAELNPNRQLNASLTNAANVYNGTQYSFAVPVGMSSTQAFVAKLRLKEMALGQGLTLNGGAEIEAGSKLNRQQLQMVVAKRW